MFLLTLYQVGINIPNAVITMWKALGFIWLVGMLFRRPTAGSLRQSIGSFVFQSCLAALGLGLMLTDWFRFGWLAIRFIPDNLWIQYVGFTLTVAGCILAIWARITLGGNWSARPSLQQDHTLVEQGPYAFARHPIYSGFVLAFLGTTIVIGEVRTILGLAVILIRLFLKMTQEEQLMLRAFPRAYPDYRRRVKALIPGVF